jgi:hypothetical protein
MSMGRVARVGGYRLQDVKWERGEETNHEEASGKRLHGLEEIVVGPEGDEERRRGVGERVIVSSLFVD